MTEQTKMLPCPLCSSPIYAVGGVKDRAAHPPVRMCELSGQCFSFRVWELLSRAPDPEAAKLIEALVEALTELTDCGAEAWGEERPCVQQARAALTLTRRA